MSKIKLPLSPGDPVMIECKNHKNDQQAKLTGVFNNYKQVGKGVVCECTLSTGQKVEVAIDNVKLLNGQ